MLIIFGAAVRSIQGQTVWTGARKRRENGLRVNFAFPQNHFLASLQTPQKSTESTDPFAIHIVFEEVIVLAPKH